MEVNIQILLYNSSKDLGTLLKSLNYLHLNNSSLSLYFVDQSENEKEFNKVKKIIQDHKDLPKSISLNLSHQPNYGFGKGHNEIYRKNKDQYNDLFIILNPDTMFMYDTVSHLVRYINELDEIKWGLLEMEQFPNEHPKYYNPITLETPWASGAGLIIKKEAFDSVGLFDENIFMYGEDVDLSISMRKKKYKVLHLPECKFIHLTKDTDVIETSSFTFNHKQAAELYLRYKHAKPSDLETFDNILKANRRNYKTIKQMYNSMISGKIERKYFKEFVDKNQDYTKFRWVL
jgi:GT2 family glycosyltransferase